MKKFLSFLSGVPLLCGFIFLFPGLIAQVQLPQGFSMVKVGTIYYPTAMSKLPDGRIFVCEKAGRVRVVKNGVVLGQAFLDISASQTVEQTNERGLSGLAFDPDFTTNHYFYVFYTTNNPVHNRLSRFTANGDITVPNSEVVLMDLPAVVNSIHNGGGMAFGPDGKLYLALGDDHVNTNAQDLNTVKGKVLRLNKDGSPAPGNPFSGSASALKVWAYGLRNPYSLDIQPGTGKVFVNEVGESSWEEINNVTTGGKNFGWPTAEGNSNNGAFTNPVFTYAHGNSNLTGCAVSGGAFFSPSSTNYPPQYAGKYFYIDYCNDWINYIDPNAGMVSQTNFASGLPGAEVGMVTGPDGNLYFCSISQSGLYKIVYNGGSAPVITQQPANQNVSAGQQASFSVTASGAAPLHYQWMRNNVAIQGATMSVLIINNAQQANQASYKVMVSNGSGSVTSNSASLTVTAFNAAPVASITAPAPNLLYRGGDTIYYAGTGTDPEDGILPAANFSWTIEFHHNVHFHPGPVGASGSKTGSFVVPFTGESSANVWYRIILVVRDSQNRTDTVYRDVMPRTSAITLASVPPGLQIALEGQPNVATYTTLAVENMRFSIEALTPQNLNGNIYAFGSWAHGGAAAQTITIPQNDFTYTATYSATGQSSCTAQGNIIREYWNVVSTSLNDIPFNTAPTGTSQLTLFEGPTNFGDNYGSRIRGYICPPATGNYTFWIASDNSSELYISTNDNPANKTKRAFVNGYTNPRQYTKYPEQKSTAVYLVTGQRYYIEAIHRENNQGDHLSVGWTLPNNVNEMPIPGSRLSPFGNDLSVNITSPANNSVFNTGSAITINAQAISANSPVKKVDFYSGNSLLGTDTVSPYSFTWNNPANGSYQLTAQAGNVANVTATSQPVNITVGSVTVCAASGNITREVWNNVSGTGIAAIPLNNNPSVTEQLTQFKAPSNYGDNYGQRICGFICPPATGNYTFWIASDDNSELWLSTNEQTNNRQKIAFVNGWTQSGEYTKYASQKSAPINLVAGQKYYIEALHKEGTQGDNLAVGWQIPGGALERPIPGSRLSVFSQPLVTGITAPPDESAFNVGVPIPITATVAGGTTSYNKVEFFAGENKIGEDLSAPFSLTWTPASAGHYHLTVKATDSGNNIALSGEVHIDVGSEANCSAAGNISREVWYNVAGTTVNDIPLNSNPATKEQINSFLAPSDVADNYGQRIRGYICAPFTGTYVFNIASDDNSELYLSTDSLPSKKTLIASVVGWTFPGEWTKYPSQQSAPINLVAGKKYYVEALHKEGDQGDNLAVGWKLPNNNLERPIPGTRLSPYLQNASVAVCSASVQPGSSTTFCEGGNVILYSNTGAGFSYQWKKNDVNIQGATSASYQTSTGGAYQVKIAYTGCQAWSAPVNVTVNDFLTARITAGGPTTFCEGENVTLYGNTCDGYIYQWKKNDVDIPGANSPNYVATESGSYQLKIVQGASINWSALVQVTVNNCAGKMAGKSSPKTNDEQSMVAGPAAGEVSAETYENFKLKVFPNPTTGMFTFDFCLEEVREDVMLIRVISASNGQVVYEMPPKKISGCVKGNIDLPSNLPIGIYVLQMTIGEKTESTKLVLYR